MAEKEAPVDLLPVKFRELYPNREEMKRSAAPIARGSVLGFLIGLLPGPAAIVAVFASYGLERRCLWQRKWRWLKGWPGTNPSSAAT